MSEDVKIDLAKLRALIVANTGPAGSGKRFTRRALSLEASDGRNPDLIRDLMKVDARKPTLQAAASVCRALCLDISTVVKGVQPANDADEWLDVCQAVQAGAWREQLEWAPDDCYQVRVGPPVVEGERSGFVVEGRSMDRIFTPGMTLECVKVIGSGLVPKDDDYVIVERKRGDLRELTCKRLSLRPDGNFELVAESTLAEFAEPLFIGRPDFHAPEEGQEITVVAIVVRAHLFLFKSDRRKIETAQAA